jgi:SAM-dependent methyltransferase
VGAAAGAFIDRIRGVAGQVSAIEPCRAYEEALFKKCFEVYPFIQNVAQGRKYDLITCFDTIEHVQDPAGVLQAAYKLLTPGGTLVVSTGEYEPLQAISRPASYFRTQHKWYWSEPSFWGAYKQVLQPIVLPGSSAWLECIHEPHGPQMYLYVRKSLMLNG